MKISLSKLGLFGLLCTSLLACSHWNSTSNESSRSISSVNLRQELLSDPVLTRQFYEVFRNPRSDERLIGALNRHKDLFFANQALVYGFDAALQRGGAPLESQLYTELWEGRHLKEHSDEFITFLLLKLEELATLQGHDSDKAAELLEVAFSEFLNLRDSERLAFIDPIETYRFLQDGRSSSRLSRRKSAVNTPDLSMPFDQFRIDDFDWATFYAENDRELKREAFARIPERSVRMKAAVEDSRIKRIIRPSVSREGNISGHEFPIGVWSLTYDDGPHRTITDRILQQLRDANIKATFFWTAANAINNRPVITRAKDLGMELANHSYDHKNVPTQTEPEQVRQIIESTRVLTALYGQPVKFFRLPYGSGVNNADIRRMIADNGMIHVFWNVDSLDWQDRNPASVFNRVKTQMEERQRGIILFHDIQTPTVETTRLLIEYVQNRNRDGNQITFKKLEEIVAQVNANPGNQGPRTTANLNVRVGPSTAHQVCAVLPAGTPVRIVRSHGGFLEIEVPNSPVSLASCAGQQFVSANFVTN
jgi:peptidoglycan/xylan/chitin deacetylase (PgdA/CDA1 family)